MLLHFNLVLPSLNFVKHHLLSFSSLFTFLPFLPLIELFTQFKGGESGSNFARKCFVLNSSRLFNFSFRSVSSLRAPLLA